jgi:thioredoxin 1
MKDWSQDQIEQFIENNKTGLVYFFTPMCGTCQMAGKMLEVVTQLFPELDFGKADLNYMPKMAERLEIESVPCLLLIHKGEIIEKIFAFHSVPYLHEKIKQNLI